MQYEGQSGESAAPEDGPHIPSAVSVTLWRPNVSRRAADRIILCERRRACAQWSRVALYPTRTIRPQSKRCYSDSGAGDYTNTPAGYALNVNGTANCAGNITVNGTTYTSASRYKTHIATLPDALEVVLSLRSVTFDWNRDAWKERNFSEGRQIGFIAREVEKVLPELVTSDQNGYKSVAYANVVPVLVEAVKQQQNQIDEKERRLRKVEAENAELKARLKAIEAAITGRQ